MTVYRVTLWIKLCMDVGLPYMIQSSRHCSDGIHSGIHTQTSTVRTCLRVGERENSWRPGVRISAPAYTWTDLYTRGTDSGFLCCQCIRIGSRSNTIQSHTITDPGLYIYYGRCACESLASGLVIRLQW
jgi:hypothetical protein